METHGHEADLGGLVAQGLSWALYVLMAAVVVVGGILLVKYLVVRFSPRRLCFSCNRYYSLRRPECPFCGAASGTEA